VPVVPAPVPVVPVVPPVPAPPPVPLPPDWAEAGTAKATVAKLKLQAPATKTFNNLEDFMLMVAFTGKVLRSLNIPKPQGQLDSATCNFYKIHWGIIKVKEKY
jgi:hypothetical protein